MTTSAAETQTPPAASGDRETIQRDIEDTRRRLGETVDALAQRLDVKSRARAKVSSGVQRAKAKPAIPAGAVAAGLAVALAVVLWRRR